MHDQRLPRSIRNHKGGASAIDVESGSDGSGGVHDHQQAREDAEQADVGSGVRGRFA